MSIDDKTLKSLKTYKQSTLIFMFLALGFMVIAIYEQESFVFWSWDNHDEIEKNLIERGRADMFMDIYPSPSNVIKMLDLGYLQWETVPDNIKPMIDCSYIEKVTGGNLTGVDCHTYTTIEEQTLPFKLPEVCFLNEELKQEC